MLSEQSEVSLPGWIFLDRTTNYVLLMLWAREMARCGLMRCTLGCKTARQASC